LSGRAHAGCGSFSWNFFYRELPRIKADYRELSRISANARPFQAANIPNYRDIKRIIAILSLEN
jgi:hypothetical protein